MDTSNRLYFLTGTLRIPASEIQPSEWVEIIDCALEECMPNLKYVKGFVEIGTLLNTSKEYDITVTNDDVVKFPLGIDAKRRCIVMGQISSKTEGELSPAHGAEYVEEQQLLLTDTGQWVRQSTRYRRSVMKGLGFRSHREGIRKDADWSIFSELYDQDLEDIIKDKIAPGSILRKFIKFMESTIMEKQTVLKGLTEKHARLVSMHNRIRFDP